ncbi:phage major capsid protein, P2 family [Sphingomonas sp. Mn802worker]|uniref:phage major capsid protein, P2 family n=1 Tax=Sphingomonas sp. Mn802worker TaxID=629773 RepID=UPI0003685772|nr:phage major capsid protein, P2 family [Sphingomonas sp. Mn802worker]
MRNKTRIAYASFVGVIAQLSNVPSAAEKFTVDPSVAQKIEERTQQSSEFLTKINFVTVAQQEGQKVGVGITSSIAGRTDTSKGERQPIDPTGLTATSYRCEQTNFDTAISYAKLDAWAHRPEFQTIVRDAIVKRQGLDRMIIGWNGTHVAKDTDREAFPLLQDVNKGWIQHTREDAKARIVSDGEHSGDPAQAGHKPAIFVSATGTADYVNLDALVFDALQLLDEQHRSRTDLVVMVSDELVHAKKFALINTAGDKATEQLARDVLLLQDKIGGKLAAVVPSFPKGTIVITTYDNLSIYNQDETRRRAIIDNPKRDQVENFESVNEAYVVEDYGLIAIYENIKMEAAPEEAPAGA